MHIYIHKDFGWAFGFLWSFCCEESEPKSSMEVRDVLQVNGLEPNVISDSFPIHFQLIITINDEKSIHFLDKTRGSHICPGRGYNCADWGCEGRMGLES